MYRVNKIGTLGNQLLFKNIAPSSVWNLIKFDNEIMRSNLILHFTCENHSKFNSKLFSPYLFPGALWNYFLWWEIRKMDFAFNVNLCMYIKYIKL